MHIIMIDNYDSFTYNLVDLFETLDSNCTVVRPHLSVSQLRQIIKSRKEPSCLVLSPGPKTPSESGNLLAYIKAFKAEMPILGICLGHQAIGQIFGANLFKLTSCHGKTSMIKHHGDRLFRDIPEQFAVGRYHSLAVTCPIDFVPIAKLKGLTMAMRHKQLPIYGLQFHPESILTPHGGLMLRNFLTILKESSDAS